MTARVSRGLLGFCSHACDLCGEHIAGSGYFFAEAGKGMEPPEAWTLCETCSLLVAQHLPDIRVEASLRLRIAVGMTASERGATRGTGREARQYDEVEFNQRLGAVVCLAFVVHALAFILVVAVITLAR